MNWNLSRGAKLSANFAIACVFAYIIPVYFAPSMETLMLISREKHLVYMVCFALSFLIFGEMLGIADRRIFKLSFRQFVLYLFSATIASFVLLLIVWFFEYNFIGRRAIIKIIFFTGVSSFCFAAIFAQLAQRYKSRVMLLVSAEKRIKIKNALSNKKDAFEFLGEEDMSKTKVEEFCRKEKVDLLVVGKSYSSSELDIISLLESGTRVVGGVDFWEKYLEKIPPREVDQAWLARVDLRMKNPFVHLIKRFADLMIAAMGLILSAPIILLSLILIGLESGFPLFFVQTRTGYMGKSYSMIKLRTMRKDAEGKGAQWAKKQDARVTFFGKFLRTWRIDEIPQFWNVIRGEMSVVGPRPERPEFQEKLRKEVPYWNSRHLVKPGMTGWAQIRFSYASDLNESEEKLSYDLYYLKNASMTLDFEILLSTLRSITKGSR